MGPRSLARGRTFGDTRRADAESHGAPKHFVTLLPATKVPRVQTPRGASSRSAPARAGTVGRAVRAGRGPSPLGCLPRTGDNRADEAVPALRGDRPGSGLRPGPARAVPGRQPVGAPRTHLGQPADTTTGVGSVFRLPQQRHRDVLVGGHRAAVVVDHPPRQGWSRGVELLRMHVPHRRREPDAAETVANRSMPPNYYTWLGLHSDATLTAQERKDVALDLRKTSSTGAPELSAPRAASRSPMRAAVPAVTRRACEPRARSTSCQDT